MRALFCRGLAQQVRQHRVEHEVGAADVDLLMLLHLVQVVSRRALRLVVAGAVHHQVDAAVLVDDGFRGGVHRLAVGCVHRQGFAAGMRLRELLQRRDVARRDDNGRARRVQLLGGGAADAGGSADQPADLAGPIGDAPGSGASRSQGLVKANVTSPR